MLYGDDSMPALRQSCNDSGQPVGVRLVRRLWRHFLAPSFVEDAKLMQVATPTIHFTITATYTPEGGNDSLIFPD